MVSFFSDSAKFVGSFGQLLGSGKSEVDDFIKLRLQRLLDEMHLVRRDEFEAVKSMAVQALEENKILREKLEKLSKNAKRKS